MILSVDCVVKENTYFSFVKRFELVDIGLEGNTAVVKEERRGGTRALSPTSIEVLHLGVGGDKVVPVYLNHAREMRNQQYQSVCRVLTCRMLDQQSESQVDTGMADVVIIFSFHYSCRPITRSKEIPKSLYDQDKAV